LINLSNSNLIADKKYIFDYNFNELEAKILENGYEKFRAIQIIHWIINKNITDFDEMLNLPKQFRAFLSSEFKITSLRLNNEQSTDDNATTKILFGLEDGADIETVQMKYDPDSDTNRLSHRTTICISTQAGCAMQCIFCATGLQGLKRNLSTSEILEQVLYFSKMRKVTNVVFMGMGEPLANYENTIRSIKWLIDENGFNLRQRGITISTVGLVDKIERLAQEKLQIGLTISLHAPNNELRKVLVPTNLKTTIDELIDAGKKYQEITRRRVTFAYALMEGINDHEEHATELASKLVNTATHVNLVPYNPINTEKLRRPSMNRINRFAKILNEKGVNTTIRHERGTEIAAACGQLNTSNLTNVKK
jgi:23S rRNA (adenine2503-C2)-methyltransferase